MIRKSLFWLHLALGLTAGLFIFIMAATGMVLAFERQITELADRDLRSIPEVNDTRQRPLNDLLQAVRRAKLGEPSAILVHNEPHASVQFAMGRNNAVYVDPYSGAVLGVSSAKSRAFFSYVERLHRALGMPLGSTSLGRWLTGAANLLFAVLIPLGVILWLPRKWSWKAVRASATLRGTLRGKARDWNWHNAIGIWCALPLLVISLTGLVMSFDWANALLFRLSGSPRPVAARSGGGGRGHAVESSKIAEPNYEYLLTAAKALDPNWRSITLDIARDADSPIPASIDAGTGGQPQHRTQYLLNRMTGAVVRTDTFVGQSLGQRLRAFVRFGHTGEYYGLAGQMIAAICCLAACVLVYTGMALAVRRLTATLTKKSRMSELAASRR